MKRYIITLSFYDYAENDQDAIATAKAKAKAMNDDNDNQCVVEAVHSAPFASLTTTEIYNVNK